MRDDVIEGLFSLFTSADRAEAMAGDLMEEREARGWVWFWLHGVRVALTLWRNSATEAPLLVLALAAAGCALFTAPAFGGLAAVRLVPQMDPINLLALMFFWWGGAFWIGASLVSLAPRRGMTACATLAVTSEALLIVLGVGVLWRELQSGDSVLFYAIGLATAAPLFLGGAVVRRRIIA